MLQEVAKVAARARQEAFGRRIFWKKASEREQQMLQNEGYIDPIRLMLQSGHLHILIRLLRG
jgi:hypothetical protein